jgi:hypothetical protein
MNRAVCDYSVVVETAVGSQMPTPQTKGVDPYSFFVETELVFSVGRRDEMSRVAQTSRHVHGNVQLKSLAEVNRLLIFERGDVANGLFPDDDYNDVSRMMDRVRFAGQCQSNPSKYAHMSRTAKRPLEHASISVVGKSVVTNAWAWAESPCVTTNTQVANRTHLRAGRTNDVLYILWKKCKFEIPPDVLSRQQQQQQRQSQRSPAVPDSASRKRPTRPTSLMSAVAPIQQDIEADEDKQDVDGDGADALYFGFQQQPRQMPDRGEPVNNFYWCLVPFIETPARPVWHAVGNDESYFRVGTARSVARHVSAECTAALHYLDPTMRSSALLNHWHLDGETRASMRRVGMDATPILSAMGALEIFVRQ